MWDRSTLIAMQEEMRIRVASYPSGGMFHCEYYNGVRYRSSHEVDFVKCMNYLLEPCVYEPHLFYLIDGRRYTPDFLLTDINVYVEIKSYYTLQEGGSKVNDFRKSFPHLKIVQISNTYQWTRIWSGSPIVSMIDDLIDSESIQFPV